MCRAKKNSEVTGNRWLIFAFFVSAAFLGNLSAVRATTFDVTADQYGAVAHDGTAGAATSYISGRCDGDLGGACSVLTPEFRNYFSFQIPFLDGPLESASLVINSGNVYSLQLDVASNKYVDLPITYSLTSALSKGWSDLGTGVPYGAITYPGSSYPPTTNNIALNSAALAAIGLLAGNSLLVGGRVTDLVSIFPLEFQFVFGGTNLGAPHLVLTTLSAVPLPASFSLFVAAVGLIGALQLYRRRRSGGDARSGLITSS